MIYDTHHFVVREYAVSDSRLKKKCRAVVLADLHNKKYGRDNELLLQAIREAKPDLILIAGDLLTARPREKLDVALQLLENLTAQYPVYYGNGNHEYRLKLYPKVYGEMARQYAEGIQKLGVHLLVNEHMALPEYGMVIYGSEIDRFYYKRFGIKPMAEDYLESLMGRVDKAAYSVLIAHNPDYFPQYAAWGADLVLSGHVHGGMVRVPFWGRGVVSPNVRLFPKYDGGRFEENGSTMLVSRGLGMHSIPIRLFNPAEVLVLDFQPEV
ncbi:MAG: metallophosphoesterase [Lachnospiraceae bacterium]|nr:metallophosphoesterase [Lachnospiraceae bacterium]